MIKRELAIFLVVGSLTVLIDYLTYRGLVWTGWMNIDLAKAVGFLTGTLFAYFANKVWTFGHKEHAPGSIWRFALLYAITLSANVLVNAGCLALLNTASIAVQIAFLIATGVSAALNFLGMKLFVFKTSDLTEKS
ncbi:GtrA family protein [Pseudomonas chlororaphis]